MQVTDFQNYPFPLHCRQTLSAAAMTRVRVPNCGPLPWPMQPAQSGEHWQFVRIAGVMPPPVDSDIPLVSAPCSNPILQPVAGQLFCGQSVVILFRVSPVVGLAPACPPPQTNGRPPFVCNTGSGSRRRRSRTRSSCCPVTPTRRRLAQHSGTRSLSLCSNLPICLSLKQSAKFKVCAKGKVCVLTRCDVPRSRPRRPVRHRTTICCGSGCRTGTSRLSAQYSR